MNNRQNLNSNSIACLSNHNRLKHQPVHFLLSLDFLSAWHFLALPHPLTPRRKCDCQFRACSLTHPPFFSTHNTGLFSGTFFTGQWESQFQSDIVLHSPPERKKKRSRLTWCRRGENRNDRKYAFNAQPRGESVGSNCCDWDLSPEHNLAHQWTCNYDAIALRIYIFLNIERSIWNI